MTDNTDNQNIDTINDGDEFAKGNPDAGDGTEPDAVIVGGENEPDGQTQLPIEAEASAATEGGSTAPVGPNPALSEPQGESATGVASTVPGDDTVQLRIVGMPYQKSFLYADKGGEEFDITDSDAGVPIPRRLVGRITRAAAGVGVSVVEVKYDEDPESVSDDDE